MHSKPPNKLFTDGRTQLRLTPLELIEHLAA
jgi:hypothetical protein